MASDRLLPGTLLRRLERLQLRVRPLPHAAITGEHRGRGHASSLDLSDHRAYAPGDDFRRVDWHAFARLGTLNVRLSEPQQNTTLHLLIDRSQSMEFGSPSKAHLALQIAACLGYIALSQLDSVRLYGMGGSDLVRSPRYWGKGQTADALRNLEQLDARGRTDLEAVLAAFLAVHPERGLVVLLSDLLSPTDFRPRLRQVTAASFDVAVLHILSEAELHPDLSGNLEIVDSETRRRRRIGVTPATLAAYERQVVAWQAQLAEDFRGLGVRYAPLVTSRPIEAVLLADLRRYGLIE